MPTCVGDGLRARRNLEYWKFKQPYEVSDGGISIPKIDRPRLGVQAFGKTSTQCMYAASEAHTGLEHSDIVPRLHEFERSRKSSDASTDNDDLLWCASRKCKF